MTIIPFSDFNVPELGESDIDQGSIPIYFHAHPLGLFAEPFVTEYQFVDEVPTKTHYPDAAALFNEVNRTAIKSKMIYFTIIRFGRWSRGR